MMSHCTSCTLSIIEGRRPLNSWLKKSCLMVCLVAHGAWPWPGLQ